MLFAPTRPKRRDVSRGDREKYFTRRLDMQDGSEQKKNYITLNKYLVERIRIN
jgi:hypothetical protein